MKLLILGLVLLILIGAAGFTFGYGIGISRLFRRRMPEEERAIAVLILTTAWAITALLVAHLTGGLYVKQR